MSIQALVFIWTFAVLLLLLSLLGVSCVDSDHPIQVRSRLLLRARLFLLLDEIDVLAQFYLLVDFLLPIHVVEDVTARFRPNVGLVHQLGQFFSLVRVVERVGLACEPSHANIRRTKAPLVQSRHHQLVVQVFSNVDQVCVAGLLLVAGNHRAAVGRRRVVATICL